MITELIAQAKEMRAARERGEKLGLSEDEIAFYDALGANVSAVQVIDDDQLRLIARELLRLVRANASIDWIGTGECPGTMHILVKRVLASTAIPLITGDATRTVQQQAELSAQRGRHDGRSPDLRPRKQVKDS